MEFNQLQMLSILVSDSNLTRAAERLGMTQSALSKRVQALETEVGCPLFERRGPKGLKPLPAALELAQVAGRVMTAWTSGVKRVQRVSVEPQHFVLVGPPLFLREVVLPWWNQKGSEFKDLQLEVLVSSLSKVSIDTIKTGADAAILEHREELSDFVCRPIYTEQWGVVRHPSVEKKSLHEYRWGTYATRDNPVDQYLVKRQRMRPVRYEFYWQDLTAIAIWVAENPGAASVLPWHAVAWLVKRNRLVFAGLGKEAATDLYLAYERNNPHHRLLKAFSTLAEIVKPSVPIEFDQQS